jgi:hypothetical protein
MTDCVHRLFAMGKSQITATFLKTDLDKDLIRVQMIEQNDTNLGGHRLR